MQNTSSSFVFRDFETSDYPHVVKLHNSLYPNDPTGLEQSKEFDNIRNVKRTLAFEDGTLKAYYQYRKDDNSKDDGMVIKIACENTISQDNLTSMYRDIQKRLEAKDLQHFIAKIHEPETTLQQFYLSEGFVEEERMWPSTLYLNTFNRETLAGALEKAKAGGVDFKTLVDFENNTTTQTMFYNCVIQCLKDVPTAEEINVWSFETWKERFWDSKDRLPEGNFMAFFGEELVGVSQLFPSSKEGNIRTGLTGVLSNHRGKGIAKALKLLATDYAIAKGFQTITTHNHSINKPMLGINETMGYVKSPAVICLKLNLKNPK